MNKTGRYCVLNINMINWLCSNGFKILKLADNKYDQRQKVAYFKDTKALRECMAQYMNHTREAKYGKEEGSKLGIRTD